MPDRAPTIKSLRTTFEVVKAMVDTLPEAIFARRQSQALGQSGGF